MKEKQRRSKPVWSISWTIYDSKPFETCIFMCASLKDFFVIFFQKLKWNYRIFKPVTIAIVDACS